MPLLYTNVWTDPALSLSHFLETRKKHITGIHRAAFLLHGRLCCPRRCCARHTFSIQTRLLSCTMDPGFALFHYLHPCRGSWGCLPHACQHSLTGHTILLPAHRSTTCSSSLCLWFSSITVGMGWSCIHPRYTPALPQWFFSYRRIHLRLWVVYSCGRLHTTCRRHCMVWGFFL